LETEGFIQRIVLRAYDPALSDSGEVGWWQRAEERAAVNGRRRGRRGGGAGDEAGSGATEYAARKDAEHTFLAPPMGP
jgi:hypothetical protein